MVLTINREQIISISSVVIFLIDVDNADFDVPAIVLCAKVLYDAQYCKGLFLFHILSPVAFCYLPSFMSFSILDFSQV